MNYIIGMKRLGQYREFKRNIGYKLSPAYNFAKEMKQRSNVDDRFTLDNFVEQSGYMIGKRYNDPKYYLDEDMRHGFNLLEKEYTEKVKSVVAKYENRMSAIISEAKEVIREGTNKPLAEDGKRLFTVLFMGLVSISTLASGIAILGMEAGIAPVICLGVSLASASAVFSCFKKKTPDEAKLKALLSEAKDITNRFHSSISAVTEKAYEALEAKYNAELDAMADEVKAEVGERVFLLFENTPFNQQEYFMQLGITATTENDFNNIAQECLKADKTQQQIDMQNMINREARDAINQGIRQLNQTAKLIHEDAEFRARQQAELGAQLARQNERSLANQAKTIEELKKQKKVSEDIEYRMRHNK